METLHTNTLGDFCVAAAIVFITFIIARYVSRSLQRTIEKDRFGPLTANQKKSLMRIPGFLRIFITARGCLLALSLFHFQPAFFELAHTVGTTITILGNVFLFLSLITGSRAGFDAWATKISKTSVSHNGNLKNVAHKPVDAKIRKARTLITLLLPPLGIIIFLPDLDLNIQKDQILYASGLFLLVNGGILVFIIRNIRKKKLAHDTNKVNQAPPTSEMFEAMKGRDPDFLTIVDIVTLFLEIVKHHIGAKKETPCRFTLVEHHASEAKYLFDLEIRLYGNWKKRRMTIGRLAADSGSRSKCFYVIYDGYLVIKVPPIPITDPTEYIDSLKMEAAIARQLDMEACIIPIVSVILKHVDPSIDARGNSIDSPEELAMISLQRRPDLYQFLKVGKTFAYFMDMSKYYFLQNVIKMLHDTPDSSNEEPFLRIKTPAEGIVANLLVLLAHIGDRGVSLRDLKPDNLLVAGDRNNYPGFLDKPKEHVIGLIDIETAVVFWSPHQKRIGQPQLGGTPRYATPTHFFTNDLIHNLYGEVADILHLQDWHGMVAVIFNVITNRYLFEKTARIVSSFVHKINFSCEEDDIDKFAVEASRSFWSKAEAEFREKMNEECEVLEKMIIPIAKPVATMFMERISTRNHGLTVEIKELITTQSFYQTYTNRHKLLQASSQAIEQLFQKWDKLPNAKTDLLKRRPQAVQFLKNLRKIKLDLERREQLLKLLDNPAPKIPARLLLETMFSVVSRRMHRRRWKELPAQEFDEVIAVAGNSPSEKTLEKTCMDYQTIIEDRR